MKDIEKWSLRYVGFKFIVFPFFRLNLRRFCILGVENIPKNKPVILAPNHQNALSDALAIVFSLPGQPVFLSRADIFKNKLAAFFLTQFKIMPVYRIRDGKESLVNNQDTFDSSIRVLKNNKMLCLFPEGSHIGMKSMLPHKKAIARIAFLAGENTNFDIDLSVVPVGIYYSHYYNFRSDLVVQYGKPIPLKEYFDIYRSEGELKATLALKDKVYTEVSSLCVDVPEKEDYDIYEQCFEIFSRQVCRNLNLKTTPPNLVKAEQTIVQKVKSYLDEHVHDRDGLLSAANNYKSLKKELKISEEALIKGEMKTFEFTKSFLFLLFLLPFSLVGAIIHGWLFRITFYSIRKKIKDPQFYSSFSLGLNVVMFTSWIAILLIIVTFLLKNLIIALLLVFISIPCAIIAWETIQSIIRINNRMKITRMKNNGNTDFKRLTDNRSFLVSRFNKILN
jgi:1-acyl-sn-glycerol-3-phosphate acyltransferase